eukprot:4973357-Prymnesium_polylepis.1
MPKRAPSQVSTEPRQFCIVRGSEGMCAGSGWERRSLQELFNCSWLEVDTRCSRCSNNPPKSQ